MKLSKHAAVTRAHGFIALTYLFGDRAQLHQYYLGGYVHAYEKIPALHDKVQKMEDRSQEEMRTLPSEVKEAYGLVAILRSHRRPWRWREGPNRLGRRSTRLRKLIMQKKPDYGSGVCGD